MYCFILFYLLTGYSSSQHTYWKYTPQLLSLYLSNHLYSDLILTPDNFRAIQPGNKILFYIHGWQSNSSSPQINDLRTEILKRNDTDFIKVDWTEGANRNYLRSTYDVCHVGNNLGDFISDLPQYNYNLSKVHVVGLSLGAHVAGRTGATVYRHLKQKVGRISGLDPAGPLFHQLFNVSLGCMLMKSDAHFVDTVHTNANILGTYENLGHVNFYANCGTSQPGCPLITRSNLSMFGFTISEFGCSHTRSLKLFTESVNDNNFLSGKEKNIFHRKCFPTTYFGYNVPEISKGKYHFKTNADFPYAMGADGYCQSC